MVLRVCVVDDTGMAMHDASRMERIRVVNPCIRHKMHIAGND